MRVLHLINQGRYGSAASIAQVCKGLAELDVEVSVASFVRGPEEGLRLEAELARAAIPWVPIRLADRPRWMKPRLLFRTLELRTVHRSVGNQRYDLVHSHDLFSGYFAAWLARSTGAALVATHHGESGYPLYIRLYELLYRLWSRRFERISTPSRALLGTLAPFVGRDRLCFIPNSLDLEAWQARLARARSLRPELGLRPDALVVGMVGRLSAEKGHSTALRALAALMRDPSVPDAAILLAGDGPLRSRLEAEATSLGLRNRVRFLGYLDDTAEVFRTIDLLIHPSYSETTPMVILEAMASSVPVAATAVGEVPWMLGEDAGIVVAPGAPDALAEALKAICERPELRRGIAERALARVRERFDHHRAARRYVEEL